MYECIKCELEKTKIFDFFENLNYDFYPSFTNWY